MSEAATAAARVSDQISHGFGLLAMVAGAVAGAAIGAAIVTATAATGGLALFAIVGGSIAGGGLSGGALVRGISTAANLPDPTTGAIVTVGSPNVFINGLPAMRAGIDTGAACDGLKGANHYPMPLPLLAEGALTVTVNGFPLGRVGSKFVCSGQVKTGSPNVVVGGPTAAVAPVDSTEALVEKALEYLGMAALGAGAAAAAVAGGALALAELAGVTALFDKGFTELHEWGNSLGPGWGDILTGVAGFGLMLAGTKAKHGEEAPPKVAAEEPPPKVPVEEPVAKAAPVEEPQPPPPIEPEPLKVVEEPKPPPMLTEEPIVPKAAVEPEPLKAIAEEPKPPPMIEEPLAPKALVEPEKPPMLFEEPQPPPMIEEPPFIEKAPPRVEGPVQKQLKQHLGERRVSRILAEKRANPKLDALLTDEEYLGIHGYTTGLYDDINPALRAGNAGEWQGLVNEAVSGMDKMGAAGYGYQGEAMRVIRLSPEQVGQIIPEPGGIFKDPAFLSSSTNMDGVMNGNVKLHVKESFSGVKVEELSAVDIEKEVLFRPGTEFEVLSKTYDPATGNYIVELKEVVP